MQTNTNLITIILTKDEDNHILRAIHSAQRVSKKVYIIDSGSKDSTIDIAKKAGAEVLINNNWVNHATQFNWALSQIPNNNEWIFRLDADEIITNNLADEILNKLSMIKNDISGIYINRNMIFLNKKIKWGGVYPLKVLRIFKHGCGQSENKWMDEHIVVNGKTAEFFGEIIDHNLNSISWWVNKHNRYASLEAIEILNKEYKFIEREKIAKRNFLKDKIYLRFPILIRSFFYFIYRYFIRLGFLDGKNGSAFHILQGFWYRYLVDTKLNEVKTYMKKNKDLTIADSIKEVLDINILK